MDDLRKSIRESLQEQHCNKKGHQERIVGGVKMCYVCGVELNEDGTVKE